MSKRKAYRPKPVTVNPMRKALAAKAVLTKGEQDLVLKQARASFEALRQGRANRQDWAYLADVGNVGEALAEIGICSDVESMALLQGLKAALKDLAQRINERGIWTARGQELHAIEAGLERHEIQMTYCSLAELRRAMGMVEKNVRAARAGRMEVVTVGEPA